MANKEAIKYAYFVENVSRKFTLRKNKCSQKNTFGTFTAAPTRYMGGAVRNNTRFGYGLEQKNYMFLRFNPRTSPVGDDERRKRTTFANASQLQKKWLKELSTLSQILNDWDSEGNGSVQGVHKLGYTFRGWVFAVAYAVVQGGGTIESTWPEYVPA